MRRIIVEGMDGTGKTSLVDTLRKYYPLTTVRNLLEDKQDFDKWWPTMLGVTPPPGQMYIHDRFFYSELVYGPVVRGKLVPSQQLIYDISEALRKDAFLIYCRPPWVEISINVSNSSHMEGVKEHLNELVDAYDALMSKLAPEYGKRFFMYNYTDSDSLSLLRTKIEHYMEKAHVEVA